MSETYDLATVGGGPAGASAAIFAARAGLRTLVLDADKGMTRRAMVNNLLGFPEGITGPDLVEAPALSVATALKVYDPAMRLDQVSAKFGQYGAGQSDGTKVPDPRLLVPSKNSTLTW